MPRSPDGMRRKVVTPLPRADRARPAEAASAPHATAYAAWTLSQLRSLGLAAAFLAPLGALAGTVTACGGAAPVQRPMVEPARGALPPPPEAATATPSTAASTATSASTTTPDRPAAPTAQGPVPVAM